MEESGQRRDYALLASPLMREEALVIAATLRAHGVDAVVGNWTHANANWEVTVALGGLQILVPSRAFDRAKALLAEQRAAAAELGGEIVVRRDRWKFWLLAWLIIPNLVLTLFDIVAQAAAITRRDFVYDLNYFPRETLSERELEALRNYLEGRPAGE